MDHAVSPTPPTPAVARRIDPAHDSRRLVLFFAGLIAFYVGAILLVRPEWGGGEDELKHVAFALMFAPTVGAVLASVFGPGVIRFGMPSWWLLASFIPALAVAVVTSIAAAFGAVDADAGNLVTSLAMIVPASLLASTSAVGEEIGWRGFLWPLLRRRSSYVTSSMVMLVVWWLYHAPLTIAGLYGFMGGLPAFTVAIAGFVLFVGVVTERSRSVWPSMLAHGAWNALVVTSFAWDGSDAKQGFTGSDYLLGEFGWLAAATMLFIGLSAAGWHLRTPTKDGLSPSGPMGYDGAVQALWFRGAPSSS